jgi:hypothetical protein
MLSRFIDDELNMHTDPASILRKVEVMLNTRVQEHEDANKIK